MLRWLPFRWDVKDEAKLLTKRSKPKANDTTGEWRRARRRTHSPRCVPRGIVCACGTYRSVEPIETPCAGKRAARGARDARVREVIERWTGAGGDTTHVAKQDGRPRLLSPCRDRLGSPI